MMKLAIQESKREQFFNHSKNENIETNKNTLELSPKQKEELNSRISSFHSDPSVGRLWDAVKSDISR